MRTLRILSICFLALLLPAFSRDPVRIALAGDSTMSNYNPKKSRTRGWGMYLEEHFHAGTVEVRNFAVPGRSTKTFLRRGDWSKTLAWKPDYVFIQFGHNDSHNPKNKESTDYRSDYKDNLRRFISELRAMDATPVLVTPMVRRTFDDRGKLVDAKPPNRPLAAYAEAMKEVAEETVVALVDLHSSSAALARELGPKKSTSPSSKSSDVTHFNEKGARAMADLVIRDLPEACPVLAPIVKGQSRR